MFVVVEGPNGVGKTAVVEALAVSVETRFSCRVHPTAEPTSSPLGQAIRALEVLMPPEALALACAADRLDHVAREITPLLEDKAWVICDRYVPSSLVLQRLDGLDLEWIWHLNATALRPDVTVYLEDDPATISSRLDERGRHSRFETKGKPQVELEYYNDARRFLTEHGWNQFVIDCRSRTAAAVADQITTRLL